MVEKGEGKIKAGGTLRTHHAEKALSAHWLGDGTRHRREGGMVPRSAKARGFPWYLATPCRVLFGVGRRGCP